MGFWISHLILEQLEEFFQRTANWVKTGGRLMFIDSLYNPQTTASNHNLGAEEHPIRERLLDNGRSFQIVKVFHAPEYLTSSLKAAGFAGAVKTTGEYFYIGSFEKV